MSGQRAARGLLKSCSKSGSQQDRVFSGARLNVLMPGCDGETFALPEMLNVETLSSQPQSASTLFLGADSEVADCIFHREALRCRWRHNSREKMSI
jgi:hypothetical protein